MQNVNSVAHKTQTSGPANFEENRRKTMYYKKFAVADDILASNDKHGCSDQILKYYQLVG